jgi:hypothetical protein
MQGNFGGRSLIVWHLTQYSGKDPVTHQRTLSRPVPVGVCQWCHTEFKPGDPDYAEVLSWGIHGNMTVANMNINDGTWTEQ